LDVLGRKRCILKKYLLLVEDERLWEKFKESIERDINSEIINLIKERVKKRGKVDE
jgi:hypothetical protein